MVTLLGHPPTLGSNNEPKDSDKLADTFNYLDCSSDKTFTQLCNAVEKDFGHDVSTKFKCSPRTVLYVTDAVYHGRAENVSI